MAESTPLPFRPIMAIVLLFVVEGVSGTFLLPFVVFMVEDFGTKKEDVGYVAGYVTSMFFIAQFFMVMYLGQLSDRLGRRPVILTGLFGNILCNVFFGLAPNLYVALGIRFLTGCVNGNGPVGKGYLFDITDATNQARAFSYREAGYAMGGLLGLLLSGFCTKPCDGFLSNVKLVCGNQHSLFQHYQYLLPCLIAALLGLTGFVTSYFFLLETKRDHTYTASASDDIDEDLGNVEMLTVDGDKEATNNNNDIDEEDDSVRMLPPGHAESITDEETSGERAILDIHCLSCYKGLHPCAVPIFLSVYSYMLLGFIRLCFDEMVVVWASSELANGGLAFTSKELGVAMGTGALFMSLFATFGYAPINRRIGSVAIFKYGSLVIALIIFVYPELHYARKDLSEGVFWTLMIVACSLMYAITTSQFAAINVIISNCATPLSQGKVSGMAFSLAAFARVIAPVSGGSLFAVSLKLDSGYPFDYHIAFYVLALLSLILYWITNRNFSKRYDNRNFGISLCREVDEERALADASMMAT